MNMKFAVSIGLLALLCGCAATSTQMVNDKGQVANCGNWGFGVIGAPVALIATQECISKYEAAGFREAGAPNVPAVSQLSARSPSQPSTPSSAGHQGAGSAWPTPNNSSGQYSSMDSGVRVRESWPSTSPQAAANPTSQSPVSIAPMRNLGLVVDDISAAMAQALGLDHKRGVLVTQVAVNSPAHQAGIAVGDVITSFNDVSTSNSDDLARALANSNSALVVPTMVVTNRQPRWVMIDFGDKARVRDRRL